MVIIDIVIESGNLQCTLFIHIVENLFTKMENLLGIQRQYRIGTRELQFKGLLDEIAEVVKLMVSREELVCEPDRGKGGVMSLRKHIEKTKQLLRESIPP